MRPEALLLHGVLDPADRPDEADTLNQVREVGAALERLGFATRELALGLDLGPLWRLGREPPAVVFYLVEALEGRAALQHLPAAVLETLGVRFTGSSALALQLATDKLAAKRLLRRRGLPTPDWVEDGAAADPGRLWIVKAVDEDASFGIDRGAVVPGGRVPERLARVRARYGGRWFAEAYVEGREFNLALLADGDTPELLPIGEIDFSGLPPGRPRIVDYDAKWVPGSPGYENTPRIFTPRPGDGRLRATLRELALACWHEFGLAGYARVDIRVDGEGRPWILEVNPNPCLSADAGYVATLEVAGLDQGRAIERILAAAGVAPPSDRAVRTPARRGERVMAGSR